MSDSKLRGFVAVCVLLVALSACNTQEKPIAKFQVGEMVVFIHDAEKYPGVIRRVSCINAGRRTCEYKIRFGHSELSEWVYEDELKRAL